MRRKQENKYKRDDPPCQCTVHTFMLLEFYPVATRPVLVGWWGVSVWVVLFSPFVFPEAFFSPPSPTFLLRTTWRGRGYYIDWCAMNRAEIQRLAEEELSRRYTSSRFNDHQLNDQHLPPRAGSASVKSYTPVSSFRPGSAMSDIGSLTTLSRPGTAPSQPQTRPSSRGDSMRHLPGDMGPFHSDRVRETLMQLKRGNATTNLAPNSSSNKSASSSRPSSAALALYELHKGADAWCSNATASSSVPASSAGGNGSFMERAKFRQLFQQLNRNSKKNYFAASWDEAALRSMENHLFQRPQSQTECGECDASNNTPPGGGADGSSRSLFEQLSNVHAELDARVTSEVGGDGLDVAGDAESRLLFFRQDLCGERLKSVPALRHFVEMILTEHDRYIQHLKRDTGMQEASLLRETLYSTVQELADAKRQFLDAEKKNLELTSLVEKLTQANEQSQKNQADLENYVDELRVTLSTFTNSNLRGAPSMRPDTSTKGGFVEAIRRLAKEVETLREENVRLSDVASSYVEQHDAQNAEMEVLLQKALNYQQQVGQLKAAVRTMKGYVEQLEQRLRELRNVHEENELLRCTVPMQVAKYEREVVVPLELCLTLAQHQLLQQKGGGSLVCPAEYADAPTGKLPDDKLVQLVANRIPQRICVQQHNTEDLYEGGGEDGDDECDIDSGGGMSGENSARGESQGGGQGGGDGSGTNPSSGRSYLAPSSIAPSEFMVHTVPLPIHLSTRFGNAKLKPMSVNDVKGLISDMFTDYVNITEKKRAKDPTCVPALFEQHAKEWSHRRLKGERVSFEQNLSLFYWADVYRYKAPEMVMFHKASVGHVSGFVSDVVQRTMSNMKKSLQQIEPLNKRQKDRIGRDAFLAVVKKELPLLTALQLEALVASSIHAQEGRYSDEVAYELFFDRASPVGVFMYDALARAIIAHAEAVYLLVEEAAYAALHERNATTFEKLQRSRDENGASGTAAVQQMIVESAVAEKVGKCPLGIIRRAILEVDPHCPRSSLWLSLAIAAGNLPEVNRTAPQHEEDALEQCYEMEAMMRNLRRGVTFVLSPPAAPTAETPKSNPGERLSGNATPATTDLKLTAGERSSRPPSAKFVSGEKDEA